MDSVKGEVVDINFMYTTLKGEEEVIIQVPNNTFFLKPIQRIPGKLDVNLYEQLSSERPYDAWFAGFAEDHGGVMHMPATIPLALESPPARALATMADSYSD